MLIVSTKVLLYVASVTWTNSYEILYRYKQLPTKLILSHCVFKESPNYQVVYLKGLIVKVTHLKDSKNNITWHQTKTYHDMIKSKQIWDHGDVVMLSILTSRELIVTCWYHWHCHSSRSIFNQVMVVSMVHTFKILTIIFVTSKSKLWQETAMSVQCATICYINMGMLS